MGRVSICGVFLAAVPVMLTGCDVGDGQCIDYGVSGSNITEYPVNPNVTTPGGIQVDTGGQRVDLRAIDCIVDAVESCFQDHEVPEARIGKIERGCLTVRVAHDWYWNECRANHQLFPCDLSYYEQCRDRVPDPENGVCACACAGVIQDYRTVIVTPDLAAFSHELTHVIHGVHDPIPKGWQPCVDGIRAHNCASYQAASAFGLSQSALRMSSETADPEPVGCHSTMPHTE